MKIMKDKIKWIKKFSRLTTKVFHQLSSTVIKAIDHSMNLSGLSCTPVAFIYVISVVLSVYRCVPHIFSYTVDYVPYPYFNSCPADSSELVFIIQPNFQFHKWRKHISIYDRKASFECNDLNRMYTELFNPLTSRPGCMPGSRYTGVGVLFFVIWSWNC